MNLFIRTILLQFIFTSLALYFAKYCENRRQIKDLIFKEEHRVDTNQILKKGVTISYDNGKTHIHPNR